MKNINNGAIVKIDTKKIKLREFVLGLFNENTIQKIIDNHSSDEIYKQLYASVKNNQFQKIYSHLLKFSSQYLNLKNFYYQKIPSFRIHRIGQKSVNYHTDVMYGHGKDVVNIWVPLTETNIDNALYISDYSSSKKLNIDFVNNQLSMSDVNNFAKMICNPQIMSYGQILYFKSMNFHGTEENISSKHRLSFDFRILKYGDSPGTKPLNEFYFHYLKSKNVLKECIHFIYKKNLFLENLSHVAQREIINAYCSENNLIAKVEETEIHGVDHYPHLSYYIYNKKNIIIVMTSILCLPQEIKMREKLLRVAKKNNIDICYALENIRNSDISIKDINLYYKKMIVLYSYIK